MEASANPPAVSPPWRLAIFVLASSVGVLLMRVLLPPVAEGLGRLTGVPLQTWAPTLMLAGGMLVAHAWTFRTVEPRGWRYVGLGRDALRTRTLVEAGGLGMAAIGLPSILLLLAGWLGVEAAAPGNSLGSAVGLLAQLAPRALGEELMLRGFVFAVLWEWWGAWRAILATSVLFGLLHLGNAGADVRSVVLVTLAGIFLGRVLVVTRSLYAAWMAHLGWNFTLAALLHAPVSGIVFGAPGFRVVDAGPDWATGGSWGPEGGVFAGAGLVLALLYLSRRERLTEHNA